MPSKGLGFLRVGQNNRARWFNFIAATKHPSQAVPFRKNPYPTVIALYVIFLTNVGSLISVPKFSWLLILTSCETDLFQYCLPV